jgi:RNA polymerase sigma-70 factor (ECF subfamily)
VLDVATLVDRCRAGDDLAWEALIRAHQSRVYAVARHYLRDPEEARDVAQEIFIRVYERLKDFEGDRFLPWLLALSRNCCIDRIRRRKVRTPEAAVPIESGIQIEDDAPSADEHAEESARKRLLYRALDRLSEINREMILLKEIQGLKLEEIAEMLHLPVGTVKSRSNRARLELARTLRGLDASYGT